MLRVLLLQSAIENCCPAALLTESYTYTYSVQLGPWYDEESDLSRQQERTSSPPIGHYRLYADGHIRARDSDRIT